MEWAYFIKVSIALALLYFLMTTGTYYLVNFPWQLISTTLVMMELIVLTVLLYYVVWQTKITFFDTKDMTI